jgi:predicted deacylase
MPALPAVQRRIVELAGLAVPFVELTGSAHGPTVTVVAGVHGCECASMEGVRLLPGLGAA